MVLHVLEQAGKPAESLIVRDDSPRRAARCHGVGHSVEPLDPQPEDDRDRPACLRQEEQSFHRDRREEALDRLAAKDPVSAELVKLLYFAGLTMEEAAAALNVSKRTAEGRWTYARAWLRQVIAEGRG